MGTMKGEALIKIYFISVATLKWVPMSLNYV